MKLLRNNSLFILMLVISACTPKDSIPPTATRQSAAPIYGEIPTHIATNVSTLPVTQTFTSVPLHPSTPPAWVADFAEPILEDAADQYPSFQDDFTSGLNHGWFYLIEDDAAKPYFAHLEEDALILRIPDGSQRRDVMAYSPHLARRNFVLSLDFKFGNTEPNDIFRIEYKPTVDQTISVDLSKNETTSIFWNLHNHWKSSNGIYDHFGPALVNIVLIMSADECALYINHDPLGYLPECRAESIPQPVHQALSFHLLSTTGNPATITIDNVKIWDLDKIP